MNHNTAFNSQYHLVKRNKKRLIHRTGVPAMYLVSHSQMFQRHEFTYQDENGDYCFDTIENIDIKIPLSLFITLIQSASNEATRENE